MTSKARKRIGWTVTSLVAAFLLFDSIGKIVGIEESVKATIELGYPINTIVPIGIILLTSTILYLIPRTSIIGVILLTGYLGGAIVTNLRVGNPLFSHVLFPAYISILSWVGIVLRNQKLYNLLTIKF